MIENGKAPRGWAGVILQSPFSIYHFSISGRNEAKEHCASPLELSALRS
jgi:hypothetical protein